MFSALWAIANQEAGTPLGQAAPYLYSMPSSTITDVVPYVPGHNVTAVIQESSSVTNSYTPSETLEVVEPLFGKFYSAIWDSVDGQKATLDVSFGQEYHQKITPGWDDVTGLGTPNAQALRRLVRSVRVEEVKTQEGKRKVDKNPPGPVTLRPPRAGSFSGGVKYLLDERCSARRRSREPLSSV